MIEIVEPGPLASVQDLGRPGWAALGVPRSGAFDRGAARLANRLVGNDVGAGVLEVTLGGLAFRALDAVTIALTGAPCPGLDWGIAVTLRPGTLVRLGTPVRGLRSYLAARGGLAVAPELGSCSSDLLSGIGPSPLQRGETLAVGPAPTASPSGVAAAPRSGPAEFAIHPGPRVDWFEAGALDRLTAQPWQVRTQSDRVGVRLDGAALRRVRPGELPSEPTLPGAVQVPADGRPIVFGPDAPVTGGYPVIAVLTEVALDAAAQVRPGDLVRFRLSSRLR
ncbi:MAG TPA: biotin-dependent carboxyltransferase family protein [Jatrophihabitans sp.]|jgi:biotin-dependent carboxylase-like uncharacterized protein